MASSSERSRTAIDAILREIEVERGVSILYACESGSRAWGFESIDSDWDVRFLFKHDHERYDSIDEPPQQLERMRESEVGKLDVVGWDLLKTLRLLRKTNPALLEWLHSPIQYVASEPFVTRLTSLARAWFSPVASVNHYASMARSNSRGLLDADKVVLKQYLYVLRPVLAVDWVLARGTIPPVRFDELVDTMLSDDSRVHDDVTVLLAKKRSGTELGKGPRLHMLHEYLVRYLAALDEKIVLARQSVKGGYDPDVLTEELNTLFRETISSS